MSIQYRSMLWCLQSALGLKNKRMMPPLTGRGSRMRGRPCSQGSLSRRSTQRIWMNWCKRSSSLKRPTRKKRKRTKRTKTSLLKQIPKIKEWMKHHNQISMRDLYWIRIFMGRGMLRRRLSWRYYRTFSHPMERRNFSYSLMLLMMMGQRILKRLR